MNDETRQLMAAVMGPFVEAEEAALNALDDFLEIDSDEPDAGARGAELLGHLRTLGPDGEALAEALRNYAAKAHLSRTFARKIASTA